MRKRLEGKLSVILPVGQAVLLVVSGSSYGETPRFWAERPVERQSWTGANHPITRVADLRTTHAHDSSWREVVFSDAHLQGDYVSEGPGKRVTPRFHPDTRIYWILFDGKIRFDIEGQRPILATKGSMVQVTKQTIYSFETIGDTPSLRLEVTIPGATTVLVQDSPPASHQGMEWLPVQALRKAAPYEPANRPHTNLFDLIKDPSFGDDFFVNGDNAIAHVVCAYEKDKPGILPGDRGHYHAEGSEVFINLLGRNRIVFEGEAPVTASAPGDIMYVPRYVFHNPRPNGPERSCRLVLRAYREPLIQFRDPAPSATGR
jgi:mannose-6-phosphate isomerase-like protein (cupin superfamily)